MVHLIYQNITLYFISKILIILIDLICQNKQIFYQTLGGDFDIPNFTSPENTNHNSLRIQSGRIGEG